LVDKLTTNIEVICYHDNCAVNKLTVRIVYLDRGTWYTAGQYYNVVSVGSTV